MEKALTVRAAYKKYSASSVVLQGLDMDVPQGAIYGLLGPSGCGKTTLLGCIVGKVKLDAGQIVTKVKDRKEVGYMPQEIALHDVLSIQENIRYYGMLNGLSQSQVLSRTEDLTNLLQLPAAENLVKNLSGGQQRRVSFAVALLHDPQLLILDEPTVGLDPVLSHSIWEHMLKLTTTAGKTIIITTHYIEEARQAHVVGLMRGGVLLAEDAPDQLMANCGCSSLEHAFLKLSSGQEGSNDNLAKAIDKFPKKQTSASKPHITSTNWFSPVRLRAQMAKYVLSLWRNKSELLSLFLLPVVLGFLVNLTIGRDFKGLSLAVVNQELENGMQDCANIPSRGCNLKQPLSCRYIDELRNAFSLIEFDSLDKAETNLRKNKVWGVLHFNSNYSEALVRRMENEEHITDSIIEDSLVNVRMDMTVQQIAYQVQADLATSFKSFVQQVFQDCQWPVEVMNSPVKIKEPVYGSLKPTFINFAAPALVTLFIFYMAMMHTIGVFLEERSTGNLERSLISGLTFLELILSHSIIQIVILSLQVSVLIAIVFWVYDNPIHGALTIMATLMFIQGIYGMCYGYLGAFIADEPMPALHFALGTYFSLCYSCGLLWPTEGMYPLLRSVVWMVPLTVPISSIRSIANRGWGMSHPDVYNGFISSAVWITITIVAICIVIKVRIVR